MRAVCVNTVVEFRLTQEAIENVAIPFYKNEIDEAEESGLSSSYPRKILAEIGMGRELSMPLYEAIDLLGSGHKDKPESDMFLTENGEIHLPEVGEESGDDLFTGHQVRRMFNEFIGMIYDEFDIDGKDGLTLEGQLSTSSVQDTVMKFLDEKEL